MEENKGITLIALVITIIVLLILAGAAVSILLDREGLFEKANEAKSSWNSKVEEENSTVSDYMSYLDQYMEITPPSGWEVVSHQTSYTGCYIDKDGDYNPETGTGIDGIIFVDYLVDELKSGEWADMEEYKWSGAYDLSTKMIGRVALTEDRVKDYFISEQPVVDARFDSNPRYVITLGPRAQGKVSSRFEVITIEDFTDGVNDSFYWYHDIELYPTTELYFGSGSTNTLNTFQTWAYNEMDQNERDLWSIYDMETYSLSNDSLQRYIPSRAEWSAFLDIFGITFQNRESYGLADKYWTSSVGEANNPYEEREVWYVNLGVRNYEFCNSFLCI